MSAYDADNPKERSLTQDVWSAARYYLGGRIGIIAMAAVALGTAGYFNWGWLVAAGLAPIILMMLPCAAMCAVGMCKKKGDRTAGDGQSSSQVSSAESGENSPLRLVTPLSENQDAAAVSGETSKPVPRNRKGCR